MPEGIYKRGSVWWCDFWHGGIRHRQSTGQTDRRQAEREARRIRSQIEETHGPATRHGLAIRMLEAIDIARARNQGLSDRRVRTIEGIWAPMLRHWGELANVAGITVGDVLAYVGERRRRARGQTIRREVQALVRTLQIARRDRMLSRLPFDPKDLPGIRSDAKLEAQAGKLWSREQIGAVLGVLSSKAITAGHLDICRLIMLTGLRIGEVWRLHPSMVVPAVGGQLVGVLHLPPEAAKWGKARKIPLGQEAASIITNRAPIRQCKVNKSLKLASSRAGLAGVLTPRDLRVFYLTHVARLSSDPVAAQRLAGHTNIATTGLYLQAEDERIFSAGLAVQRYVTGTGA